MSRLPWGCKVLVGAATALCVGFLLFVVGYFVGSLANDVNRGNHDIAQVNGIIAANPDRFGTLSIIRGPADKFRVEGTVEQPEDLDFLREELVRALGETRADFVLAVQVKESADGG